MAVTLPNWRKGVIPHEDIRNDQVSEALFAVNLSRAIADEGADEYRNPQLFFQRTYLTQTLQSMIKDVLQTLRGEPGANSVIHMQTNYGGGKSHTKLALYHLLKSPKAALLVPQVSDFLQESGAVSIPQAAVAALPCADLFAGGRQVQDGLTLYTLWGEIAYRLGGIALYEIIREADQHCQAPGVILLRKLLTEAGPNLILMDELLHYVDKATAVKVGDSNLATQTLGFLRELSEAVDAVSHSVLVASLTASRMESITVLSEEDAEFTLTQMEDTLRRMEDSRTPVESSEIYDIARIRLFEQVDQAIADQVVAAYKLFYRSDPWRDLLPPESREESYDKLLRRAYPFHPSTIQVLYERWGSRPQFQLTRGTLRFLSHLLACFWNSAGEKARGPLIHLGDVNLQDSDVRGETIRVAGSEWEAVLGTDIASTEKGELSIAQRKDQERGGLYTKYGLVQSIAASVFMFTHGGLQKKPTPQAEVRLAVAQPAIPLPDLNQAFEDCREKLYYYYEEDGGYIFKTEPNPNKVLADERANIETDEARRQVETVVADVVGDADLFRVSLYGFHAGEIKEPGDIPDESRLQMVVLPPRLAISGGKALGKTALILDEITQNYGKKLRMNRNLVLYLVPDSKFIANAIDRAMDWLGARNVRQDKELMARFTESQQEMVHGHFTQAINDTKDHIRKAYHTILLPTGSDQREVFELSYVPPSKLVLEQAAAELLHRGKIHQEFNPALLEDRWASLWPKTSTITTTESLWEKFARQGGSPILTDITVLQATIRQGVERELFGYGAMRDSGQDKLKAGAYERVFLGPFDAREIGTVEISARTVLMRPDQVYALFPPINQHEVAMLVRQSRQTVESVFRVARSELAVEGRVDRHSFFNAICAGVAESLFGYAESLAAPILIGSSTGLTSDKIQFSGLLIREDVPLPITADEVANLVPDTGRIAIQDLQQQAELTYGPERATIPNLLNAVKHCVTEGRFGYAPTQTAALQTGGQEILLEGYLGHAEALPPDTLVIQFSGSVSSMELAQMIKTVSALSKLGQSGITLQLRIDLQGDINEHSVTVALKDLENRVPNLQVELIQG